MPTTDPLTAGETLEVIELLEAWVDDTGVVHDGFGVQLTLTELDTVKTEIEARITAFTGAMNTRAREILTDYEQVRDGDIEVDGGVGGIGGVKMSFAKERARARMNMMRLIPVMHIADAMKQKRGPSGSQSAQIPFMRC